MAGIVMQDPLTTEIQSPFLAGIVEGLNRISTGLDMKTETLTKVSMSPVQGLESSDPRRIYQVADGNRLWLNSPEPQIYLNNSAITPLSKDFTIDYVGGSITFYGSYRPSASDKITVSCDHVYATGSVSGGYEIVIRFAYNFVGQEYSVSGGEDEYYTGIVPESLEETVVVKSPNTEYKIVSKSSTGEIFNSVVTTGEYYGKYYVDAKIFNAQIIVNSVQGSEVEVSIGSIIRKETVSESGSVTVEVDIPGNYSVRALYSGAYSETKVIQVDSEEEPYQVTLNFITITVSAEQGSTVSVTDKTTTLEDSSTTGTVVFYIPNVGSWTVSAEKSGSNFEETIQISEYKNYEVEVKFIDPILENNSWELISYASSKGIAGNYWEVGDTKGIVINGTVVGYNFSNLSIDCFIIGLNHNATLEGNNLIHFEIGKIGTKNIALCHSNYGNTGSSNGFRINLSNTNVGGWESSYMRETVLGNTSTPNSPATGSFMSALPSDLRAVIKPVTKYTDNVGGGKGDVKGSVTGTTDYIFLIGAYELFWDTQEPSELANSYEQNYQSWYSYYESGNSKKAYKHSSTSTEAYYWLRSPRASQSGWWRIYTSEDEAISAYPSGSSGIKPCFCV